MTIAGEWRAYEHVADRGNQGESRFCPVCASTVAYVLEMMPGTVAVPLGAFAGEDVPTPAFSVWEERKQLWIEIVGEGIERQA